MHTTAITFIHEDLRYETILVEHKEAYDELMMRLDTHYNPYDTEKFRTITLVDVVIFLYKNNYQIIENRLFDNKEDYENSNLIKKANNRTEFAFDLEFTLYN
ncbi:hypothetical protein V9L05_18845 [Bernardetia sp. Wsw4-3y2]|uniref:hypothetical protein n=1 Tax=Bernardetia sp. Wsw4-3y2 TaxID=3127471 RepID=UPI0030CC97EA